MNPKPVDTRNLADMPNTLAWLKAKIKGFEAYYEAAQRSRADTEALRAKLKPKKEPTE